MGFFNNMKEITQMFHWEKNLYKSFSICVNKRNYLSPLSPVSPTQNICYELRPETKLCFEERDCLLSQEARGELWKIFWKATPRESYLPLCQKSPISFSRIGNIWLFNQGHPHKGKCCKTVLNCSFRCFNI